MFLEFIKDFFTDLVSQFLEFWPFAGNEEKTFLLPLWARTTVLSILFSLLKIVVALRYWQLRDFFWTSYHLHSMNPVRTVIILSWFSLVHVHFCSISNENGAKIYMKLQFWVFFKYSSCALRSRSMLRAALTFHRLL